MKTKRRRTLILINMILGLLVAALITAVVWNRSLLTQKSTYTLMSSSAISVGHDGNTLVIDNGKKTLLVLDRDDRLVQRLDGGSLSDTFFYACHAAQTDDGRIYLAEIAYGDRGNLLDRERIIRLNAVGADTLFETDYTDWAREETPLQYGRILEIQASGNQLWFLLKTADALELKRIEPDGRIAEVASVPVSGVLHAAAYDIRTNRIITADRHGNITVTDPDSRESRLMETPESLMPNSLCARNGEVYYTELQGRSVHHFSLEGDMTDRVVCTLESIPFTLGVSDDGQNVVVTDQAGFYKLTGNETHTGAAAEYVSSARVLYYGRVILIWAMAVISALCILYQLIRIVILVIRSARKNERTLRVLLIVTGTLTVSFIIGNSLLSQLMDNSTFSIEKQVALFSELLNAEINRQDLLELDSADDYGSAAYTDLKATLDRHTWKSYDRGDYYYYILYRIIDGNVAMVMDFEDTMPCARPMYPDDPEDNEYAAVLHTGKDVLVSEISAYGAWVFQLTPVYDDMGQIIGELEVGQSLDSLQRQQNALRREQTLQAATSTIVITMLLLEFTFLIAFLQRKREFITLDQTEKVPLRTMMFLIYLADSMQDAFIAILCTQLYQGGLPVPDGVAVALPMSAQLLMMALLSLFAGRMVEKHGSRSILTLGMLVLLAGFICCPVTGTYWGVLAGKMLIGSGMGIVYVSCNTVASAGSTSEKVAAAFADVSAGTISGLTIGAGLSSMLLSRGRWQYVYIISAVIATIGVLLAFTSSSVHLVNRNTGEADPQILSIPRFFLNRRVLGFFMLILLPFMMALSYREYFFPLYAAEHGMTEVRIGQIYLVCGMMVLYIGPVLSSWLIRHLGSFWSVVLASGLMAANMLLFILYPSMTSVLAGVVLLSVVISFAYTCQYSYFEQTPESAAFGEGRSMGVYSVFESLGQTVGPIVYGALLTFGYRKGIGIFCTAMLFMLLSFVILMRRTRKIYRIKKKE